MFSSSSDEIVSFLLVFWVLLLGLSVIFCVKMLGSGSGRSGASSRFLWEFWEFCELEEDVFSALGLFLLTRVGLSSEDLSNGVGSFVGEFLDILTDDGGMTGFDLVPRF